MSQINVNRIADKTGVGAPEFPYGIQVTGIVTATTLNQNVVGVVTATSFSGPLTGNVTGDATGLSGTPNITVQDATVQGNLTVNGTQTVIDTATLSVEDKNIGIGSVTTPSNTTATGGGLTLFGGSDGDKEFKWIDSSSGPDYWSLTGGSLYAGEGITADKMLKEKVNIVAASVYNTGVMNLEDGMVHYFTTAQNGVSNRVNIRYSATETLNDAMNVGEAITVTLITAVNNSANYVANLNIDGVNQSPNFIGGSWSNGGSSGVDIYTFNIIKTAANTYTTIANQTKTS